MYYLWRCLPDIERTRECFNLAVVVIIRGTDLDFRLRMKHDLPLNLAVHLVSPVIAAALRTDDRHAGFAEEASVRQDITVLASVYGNWNKEDAMIAVDSLLVLYPHTNPQLLVVDIH